MSLEMKEFLSNLKESILIDEAFENYLDFFHSKEEVLSFLQANPSMQERVTFKNARPFFHNAYLKNICVPEVSKNGIQMGYREFSRYDALECYPATLNSQNCTLNYQFVDLKKSFRYPYLESDGIFWMGVVPREIGTFEKSIQEAHGNVLVIGCGIGYFAYMISLKKNVSHVTVVDLDSNILNNFQKHILPQFPNPSKVSLVEADAFSYMNAINMSQYHCCFVDIWKDVLDMSPLYLKSLEIEQKYPNVFFDYWLEEKMKTDVFSSLLKLMSGLSLNANFCSLMAAQWYASHDFKTPEELKQFLFQSNFRKMILETYREDKGIFSNQLQIDQQRVQEDLEMERQFSRARHLFFPNF